ncbi:MAG: ParB N-terminal domain-containing protein [Clostridia bacterium]|nr:ParB N-terminal domain-containing protein [Clostridia bacterium]
METKGKVRSFVDIFGEDITPDSKVKTGITEIEISKLVPFSNHPFKLYEGERLHDMVTSIKELGVILPIVIRPRDEEVYEILSGHNRVNAAKIAGLEKVPTVIKEGLSDDEANLIVTETNLLQRSFSDLSYSERAVALATHYNAIKHQGKRNDLINEIEMLSKVHDIKVETSLSQVGARMRSDEKVGEKYNLSKNTVARYLRLNELIPELLERVDNEEIAFIPAVALSFIKKSEQQDIERIISDNNFKVDMVKADILRSNSEAGSLPSDRIYAILSGELGKKKKSNKPVSIKIKPKVISRFFKQEQKPTEIEEVIEKALELYFSSISETAKSSEDMEADE